MGIKTRDSLKTIKVFDRAEDLAQKTKDGFSSMRDSAEQTQSAQYESASEYASQTFQDRSRAIGRGTVTGVKHVGKWGARQTKKGVRRLVNKVKNRNKQKLVKRLNPPKQRKIVERTRRTVRNTARAVKRTIKFIKQLPMLIKKAITATIKFIKAAAKAIAAAVKAIIAGAKALIAAIVAGGWTAVVIIVIICVVALLIGGMFAIFTVSDNGGLSVYDTMSDLKEEHIQKQNNLVASCQYDVLEYEGSMADWNEVIAVFMVMRNYDEKDFDKLLVFDSDDAELLKKIFWDMNKISVKTEPRTIEEIQEFTDENGNVTEKTVLLRKIYLTVISESVSAEKVAEKYNFSEKKKGLLTELLQGGYADMDNMIPEFVLQ